MNAQQNIDINPSIISADRAFKRPFKFHRPEFPEGLHQPGSLKYGIIDLAIVGPDPGRSGEVGQQIPDRFSSVLNVLNVHDIRSSGDLFPGIRYYFLGDILSFEDNMEMKMPALPAIRRLDDVEAAGDLPAEAPAQLGKPIPDLLNVIPAEFTVGDIPSRQR